MGLDVIIRIVDGLPDPAQIGPSIRSAGRSVFWRGLRAALGVACGVVRGAVCAAACAHDGDALKPGTMAPRTAINAMFLQDSSHSDSPL